jgi:nucleoid DNA-binding protein
MEDLGKHISELLYDHDCVIVPAFGGFLASNQPARIVAANHAIYPPYRLIAFNVFLKQNDGLLANHLVESKNIQYAEALHLINSFAESCIEALENGKQVNVNEVGTLFYDKEKNIQFEAFRNITHRKESFGLEAVNFILVQRGEKTETTKSVLENGIRPSVHEGRESFKQKILQNKGYIGAVFVGAAMVWLSLNLFLSAPKNYESTSLNPFDSQETIISKTDSLRNIPSTIQNGESYKNDNPNIVVVPSVETTSVVSSNPEIQKNNSEPLETASIKPIVEPPPVIVEKKNTISRTGNNYYAIAGVFKIKENAINLVNTLQQQGFADAALIEVGGRSYVAYESVTTPSDAISMVDSLRKKNLESWIWKH